MTETKRHYCPACKKETIWVKVKDTATMVRWECKECGYPASHVKSGFKRVLGWSESL